MLENLTDAEKQAMIEFVLDNPARFADSSYALPETLEKLADTSNSAVLRAVARNPKTPTHVLEKLWARWHLDKSILSSFAGNSALPHSIQERLVLQASQCKGYDIFYRLACNPNAASDVLKFIVATNKNSYIRREVARNPAAPAELKLKLVADKSYDVRFVIAEDRNAPAEVLRKLYRLTIKRGCTKNKRRQQQKESLLYALVVNEACPEDVVLALSLQQDFPGVQDIALRRLKQCSEKSVVV
ncbi:MAG: hypothetical protein AB1330_01815 [Bacillota bacterium]